jgi:5-(carboxyamino)imidazole ribonucleotide mutase
VKPVDVVLFLGSASDYQYLKPAVEVLQHLGVRFELRVTSAHRTPRRTESLVREAEAAGCRAFICAAGMAAHLAGVVASQTVRPVLGVPMPGGVLDGVDALLATVQMPGGVPVATFAVGAAGARNAAVFAAQVLASSGRDDLEQRLLELRSAAERKVEDSERELLAASGLDPADG